MQRLFSKLGEFAGYCLEVLRSGATGGFSYRALRQQFYRVGVESLTVVNLCAFFIGMVLVIQTESMLRRFGAETQVGSIVTASFVREIGPVFAAIMFAGRVGTGIAAEIASMVVTEQVDAFTVFGASPVARLAAPRVIASALMLPALTMIANVVGVFSGYLLVVVQRGEPGAFYLKTSLEILTRADVLGCVLKSLMFGLGIGLVATFSGFEAERDTEAVGRASTRSMVQGVLTILILDLILTKVLLAD